MMLHKQGANKSVNFYHWAHRLWWSMSSDGSCVKDAVAEAFSVESNLASWAAVGAVPFTMRNASPTTMFATMEMM